MNKKEKIYQEDDEKKFKQIMKNKNAFTPPLT